MNYDKYEKFGDLHWQWYRDNTFGYKDLVDQSLKPFIEESNNNLGWEDLGGPTLVDIGCGDGLPLSILETLGYACLGVEPNIIGLEIAERKLKHSLFLKRTAKEYAKLKRESDYLYCLNTIEHLEDPKPLLDIMKRVKKFGVIVTDDGSMRGSKNKYHSIEYTPQSFRELFKDFNLEPITIYNPEFFGYKVTNK